VRSNVGDVHLQRDDVTIAEVLGPAGWRTGIFGKWGLGVAGSPGTPGKQGFDESFGFLHQVHAHYYYPTYLWEDGRRYELIGNDGGPQGQSGAGRSQYAPDNTIGRALSFIRTHRDEPFFCYVPSILPHVELLVPDESMEPYVDLFDETPYPGNGRYAAQPMPRAAFAGMVSHLDTNVGLLLELIDELGLAQDTLVIFTSDNGPEQGVGTDPDFFAAAGPLRGHKRDLYEGGIRVPLIVRWEGHIEPRTTSDLVVSFADIFPTVA
jgi:arylsulfatase A-like enzyme